jgi:signal transduction histidine kinase
VLVDATSRTPAYCGVHDLRTLPIPGVAAGRRRLNADGPTPWRRPHARGVLTTFGALGALLWALRRWLGRGPGGPRHSRGDAQRLLGHERLAMVAHELRTPVGAIRHAAVALEHAAAVPPDVQAACAIIRRQTEQIGRLVDDLLVPSGARGEALGLGLEPLDVGVVVRETVDALRGVVEERGHELRVAVPSAPLIVRGDADRLGQVVTNLVWNAAKFTPAGGHIAVTLAREGDEALIRVHDNGIGIAPGMASRIFRLFTRAAPPGDHGRGIGLSLVELIIARHGGRVTVHSEGPGRGSEFVVRLPLPATPARAEASGGGRRAPGVTCSFPRRSAAAGSV